MSVGRWPDGRGRARPRRAPSSSSEPGSECEPRASRRGHVQPPALGTAAAGDCGGDRPSAPRPPRLGPAPRRQAPSAGPSPGRPPPAAALPAPVRPEARPSRYILGHGRPTGLLSLRLRVGPARRSSPAGVTNAGL